MNAAEPSALNDLLKAWRRHPDEDATIALCSYLGATLQLGLIGEVGRDGESRYSRNADVLLAVGRMYLAASMFPAAWRAFAYARRADQNDPRPFRYLAEVLLQQGEATRASELLQRALEHGVTSNDILTLNEQLVEYMEVERTEGPGAVAARVAGDSTHLQLMADGSPISSRRKPAVVDDDDTQVFLPAVTSTLRAELQEGRNEFVSVTELFEDAPRDEFVSVTELFEDAPRGEFLSAELLEDTRSSSHDSGLIDLDPADLQPLASSRVLTPPPAPPLKSSPVYAPAMRPAQKTPEALHEDSVIVAPARSGRPSPRPPLKASSAPVPRPTLPPGRVDALSPDALGAPRLPTGVGHTLPPLADRTVVARKRPTRSRKANGDLLHAVEAVLAVALLGAISFVVYSYASEQQRLAKESISASEFSDLARLNRQADPKELRKLQDRVQALHALHPGSARLERFRVSHCVVQALASGERCRDLPSALRDAEAAGVRRRARVAGELLVLVDKGDLAGAVGLVRQWETALPRDPYFQIMAGMALELTADPNARDFYRRARELDPGLRIAAVLEARLALLDSRLHPTPALVQKLLAPIEGSLEARVLSAWADLKTAAKVDVQGLQPDPLMAPARPLFSLLEAREALRHQKWVSAGSLLEKAMIKGESPIVIARLGSLALDAGRADLTSSVAARLEAIDADEPTARVLRARTALLGAHGSEVARLAERLLRDPLGKTYAIDLAQLGSIVAYEEGSAAGIRSALGAAGTDVAMSEALLATAVGLQLLSGGAVSREELDSLFSTRPFWGDVVGVDAALDAGDVEFAEKVIERWPAMQERPPYLLRLARLRRYQGRFREGLDITSRLMPEGARSPRVLTEHALLLLAAGESKEIKALLAAHPEPRYAWLTALVEFGSPATKVGIRTLPLPVEEYLDQRIVTARALGLARDARAPAFIEALQRDFPNNPTIRRLATR